MTAPRPDKAVRPSYRLHELRADAVDLGATNLSTGAGHHGDDDLFLDSDWSPAAVAALLEAPGCFALAARAGARARGLVLGRAVARECEILWLAVAPAHRRRGLGRRLLQGALDQAARRGAETVCLEVAVANAAARALYEAAGFQCCGRRPGYYAAGTGTGPGPGPGPGPGNDAGDDAAGGSGDALILKMALASAEEREPPRREIGMKKAEAQTS
ncbi:MAG: GNAT family N-acetyltransferase [Kiloniellales bacterium]|nr:GNAT family N-acetyltransferase [Kiloniellales bacterium]